MLNKITKNISPTALIDVFVCVLGIWTLMIHLIVAFEGSLFVSTIFTTTLIVFVGFLWQKLPENQLFSSIRQSSQIETSLLINKVILLIAIFLFILWIYRQENYLFWLGSVVLLIVQVITLRKSSQESYVNTEYKIDHLRLTWGLALTCAVISLIAHRPDADDSYYLNQAAVVADRFFQPIPDYYTMFPGSDTPFPFPAFPLTAYHHFIGLLSWLLHIEPLAVCAYVLTPVLSLLVVFAYSILLKTLLPRVWLWALAGLTGFLLIDGTAHQFFSNFAFVRIWQGKSALLHILMPAVMTYGLWFGSSGGIKNWMRLAFAQISMVGLSSIGIWMGLVIASTSIIIGVLSDRIRFNRLAVGMLSCFYPLLIGIFLYKQSQQTLDYRFEPPNLSSVYLNYFGSFKATAFWFGMMFFAAFIAPNSKTRWFCAMYALIVLLTFHNPYLVSYVAKSITSSVVFWRILWLLPLPVMGAAVLCAGFNPKLKYGKIVGPLWLVTLLVGYALFIPSKYLLSRENNVSLGKPSLKVSLINYDVARFLTNNVQPGSVVIAPEEVSWILPTFRNFVYPLMPRRNVIHGTILNQMQKPDEYYKRLHVTEYVEGKKPVDVTVLLDVIQEFNVSGIVVKKDIMVSTQLNQILFQAGFYVIDRGQYDVWLKKELPKVNKY